MATLTSSEVAVWSRGSHIGMRLNRERAPQAPRVVHKFTVVAMVALQTDCIAVGPHCPFWSLRVLILLKVVIHDAAAPHRTELHILVCSWPF